MFNAPTGPTSFFSPNLTPISQFSLDYGFDSSLILKRTAQNAPNARVTSFYPIFFKSVLDYEIKLILLTCPVFIYHSKMKVIMKVGV